MDVEIPAYLSVEADGLGQGTPVKVRISGDMDDIARDIARVMLDSVDQARQEGRSATMIVPVGPVELPGVKKDAFKLAIKENTLTVSAEKKLEENTKE